LALDINRRVSIAPHRRTILSMLLTLACLAATLSPCPPLEPAFRLEPHAHPHEMRSHPHGAGAQSPHAGHPAPKQTGTQTIVTAPCPCGCGQRAGAITPGQRLGPFVPAEFDSSPTPPSRSTLASLIQRMPDVQRSLPDPIPIPV